MNRFFRITVLAAAGAALLLTSFEFAAARDRYHYWRDGHRGHYHNGRWVAAGVLGGLAAGVIVGSALAQPEIIEEERVYVEPEYAEPDVEYVEPLDEYDGRGERLNDEAGSEDYFPDRPQARRSSDYAGRGTIEPWTEEWRAYCSERYQSFNARTGTYTGYDGQRHFCTAG